MASISFLYPPFLFLLFLVPLFILIYFLGLTYSKKKAITFGNFEALERTSGMEVFSKNFLSLYLNIAILCLLIFTVSGTIVSYDAKTSSFSYVVAIDNSWSMKATDILPTRLDSAKDSAERFIDSLPAGVEVAVLEFSGDAKIMQKMDTSKLRTKIAIDSIAFGDVQGTNIYNAVIGANQLFEETNKLRSLILISDGQLNVGDTPEIIAYAKRNNILINTIIVGTEEGGETEWGSISKVDEDILKSLAFNTEGKFLKVEDLGGFDDFFASILSEIDKEISIDISFYLILVSIALFLINWVMHNFRFRILP